jgi:hypothetical protein
VTETVWLEPTAQVKVWGAVSVEPSTVIWRPVGLVVTV